MSAWLIKSEPSAFSIDDLYNCSDHTDHWDGVRNYQARNFMRQMQLEDDLLFYHSNCKIPGIVGLARVVREAYPDFTAWDPKSHYFDAKSSPEQPRWSMVDVRYERQLQRTISLAELKNDPALEGLPLIRKGNRLSVMPVSDAHYRYICDKEKQL